MTEDSSQYRNQSFRQTKKEDNNQINRRGSEPQVIPILNSWTQLVLLILITLIARYYQKRVHRIK